MDAEMFDVGLTIFTLKKNALASMVYKKKKRKHQTQ